MPDPDSRLRVSIVDALGRPVRARALASWLARTAPRAARGDVTIALVSDARIRRLNRQYRKKDAATDVLSFPASGSGVAGQGSRVRRVQGSGPESRVRPEGRSLKPAPRLRSGHPERAKGESRGEAYLGDIVVARGVAARQAREAGHSLDTELRMLTLHGLLHLLGYDHERDRGEMRRVEARLRRKGGLRAGLIERAR